MKLVQNVSGVAREPADERLPAVVEPGQVVEVDDDALADALLAQPANWSEAKPAKADKGGKAAEEGEG